MIWSHAKVIRSQDDMLCSIFVLFLRSTNLNRWVNLTNCSSNILTPSEKWQKEHILNRWKSREKRGTLSWHCITSICNLFFTLWKSVYTLYNLSTDEISTKSERFYKSKRWSAQNFYHGKQLLEQFVRLSHRFKSEVFVSAFLQSFSRNYRN